MSKRLIMFFGALFLIAYPAYAQQFKIPKGAFRVAVDVSGKDEIANKIQSYINRELRRLPDVTVVESKPLYSLSIVAIATGGYPLTSYAISLVVNERYSGETWFLKLLAKDNKNVKLPESIYEYLDKATKDLVTFEHHELLLVPMDSLRERCEGIVATFDTKFLEPRRIVLQEYLDQKRERGKQNR